MNTILDYIPVNAKQSPNGWLSFNCPACVHVGETPDKRKRGGLLVTGDDWSYSCFNCGFKTRFVKGSPIYQKTRNLLTWLGVPDEVINSWALDSIRNRSIEQILEQKHHERVNRFVKNISFTKHELPNGARLLSESDTRAVEYLVNRGIDPWGYPYFVTPNGIGRERNRIIIPFYHGNDTVGWVDCYLDGRTPKYKKMHLQPGYLFGVDLQPKEYRYIILVEGIFDAIAVNGVALQSNTINDGQIALLRNTGKKVIFVPDQDSAGLKAVSKMLESGFDVAIPDWDETVKDVNDAVKKYGLAGTILSIMMAKTKSKPLLQMAMNKISRRTNGSRVKLHV